MIYLYHGTDKEFDVPLPERGRRGTDFGQGFYLTPHFDSAASRFKSVQYSFHSVTAVSLLKRIEVKHV